MQLRNIGRALISDASKQRSICPHDQAGYTLLEMLVVLGIIAALTALAAPQVIRYLGDARSDSAKVQIKNIQSALELYYLDTGTYPTSEQGLIALIVKPPNATGWRGPYLKREDGIMDPWARTYIFKQPGEHGSYDVSTLGKDGVAGGEGENADIDGW
jgi:general secretion pathway protein G